MSSESKEVFKIVVIRNQWNKADTLEVPKGHRVFNNIETLRVTERFLLIC